MSSSIAALAVGMAFVSSAAAGRGSDVSVTYRAPSKVVLHEPIIVEVALRNDSARHVRFDLGFNRQAGFAVRIKLPDGTVTTPQIEQDGVGRIGRVTVGPSMDVSHELLLNDWMRFDEEGVYEVAMRLTNPILTHAGETVQADTLGEFRIAVGSRNAAALQRVCERLTSTIVGHWPAEERLNAARALSYITDPVVIPFVKQVLSVTDEMDARVVDGLVRLGDSAAHAVLVSMAQSAKAERSAIARDGLRRVSRRR